MATSMRYQVVVEYDRASRPYTATVAGLPNIVVDAKSERSAVQMARKAIELFVREGTRPSSQTSALESTVRAKIVAVDV